MTTQLHTYRFILLLAAGIFFCLTATGLAQKKSPYEEIVISFEVPKLLATDMFVQYDGQSIYIPFLELFRLLELAAEHNTETRTITGFIITPEQPYRLDLANNLLTTADAEQPIPGNGYYYTGYDLYLRIDLYPAYFGLPLEFDFPQLKVTLPLDTEFPAWQRLQRRKQHEKLLQQRQKDREIRTVPFEREYLDGLVSDWQFSTNPLGRNKTHYFNLGLGGMVGGGDLSLSMTGNTNTGISGDQFNYKWHYYINDNPYLTQVELGDVYVGGPLSRRVTGALLTNKPQARRKLFQTIEITDVIGPNWEVELYIDNRLTDFMTTGPDGTYLFNVDIFYGASVIMVKLYGPNGELRVEEQDVKIPYTLIPEDEIEYSASVGWSDSRYEKALFSQTAVFYGLTPRLTAGLSADLPMTSNKAKTDDFFSAGLSNDTSSSLSALVSGQIAYQPLTSLTISGFASPGNAYQAGVSYSLPRVVSLSGSGTLYEANRMRNPFGKEYSLNTSVSTTLRLGRRYLGLRLNASLDKFPTSTQINGYFGANTTLPWFYANYTARYKYTQYTEAVRNYIGLTSQVYFGTNMIRWIRPQIRVEYDHSRASLQRYGLYLTRRVFRTGQISLSLERNVQSKTNLLMVTLNLFTDFASFNSRVSSSRDQISMSQSQNGSVRYVPESGGLFFDHRGGIGQGAAVLRPFIDDNVNGRYDDGEKLIDGLRAKIAGAGTGWSSANRVPYYKRLRPYEPYVVEVDPYSLDNPLLKPMHVTYKVTFNPNMVTPIDVPIVTVGEISGTVSRLIGPAKSGIGGIRVFFTNTTLGGRTEVTTFSNGEFYYLGLLPGNYEAVIDADQLRAYGYRANPEKITFTVSPKDGRGFIEDVNFVIEPVK